VTLPPTTRLRSSPWRAAALAASAALLASAVLNAWLAQSALQSYRGEHAVRLDPAGLATFGNDAAVGAMLPLPLPAPGRARLVLLGDSRIAQWGVPPLPSGFVAVNRGVGGQTSAQILLRLDRDALALGPRVVVVEAGINDLKTIGLFPSRRAAIVRGCLTNLRGIVARLRGGGVVVVVLTVFPVGRVNLARRPFWSDATVDAVGEVNRAILGMAGPGVVAVDCDAVLAEGRRINPAFEADTLHLNPAGYRALDAALRPALARIAADFEADAPHAVQ